MKLKVQVPGQGISETVHLDIHIANPVSDHVMQQRADADKTIIGYLPAIHRGDRFQRFYPVHQGNMSEAVPHEDNMDARAREAINKDVKAAIVSTGGLGGYSLHRTYEVLFYPDRLKKAPPLEGGDLLKRTAKSGFLGILKTIFS